MASHEAILPPRLPRLGAAMDKKVQHVRKEGVNPMTDQLATAQKAHAQALDAQQAMREASHKRDAAVLAARAAGVPAAELAATLGVNRHRIHAMIKAAERDAETG